jgi:hypothetical protein
MGIFNRLVEHILLAEVRSPLRPQKLRISGNRDWVTRAGFSLVAVA